MHIAKRKALEAAGWRLGDAADFLRMTDEQRQVLGGRAAVTRAFCQKGASQNAAKGTGELDKRPAKKGSRRRRHRD